LADASAPRIVRGVGPRGYAFPPTWAAVLIFDEAEGQIVGRILLTTGTPMSIRLAPDRKKIYVATIDHNRMEVIGVPTRKVIKHFVLNTATTQYRFRGGAVDPGGDLSTPLPGRSICCPIASKQSPPSTP